MYSTLDKAIVAAIMGVIGIVSVIWKPVNITSETVATIVGIVTPVLVYLWPNAPRDK